MNSHNRMQLNEYFEYEVAISFAGEQREAAEAISTHLKAAGVSVFYDKDEKAVLWGKDLYVHLSEIYQFKAQYCILLASREYADKVWTNHERQAAQARALLEKGREYILPVRMDNTQIPGLPGSVGFLDYRSEGPEGIVKAFLEKTRKRLATQSSGASKAKLVRSAGRETGPVIRIMIEMPVSTVHEASTEPPSRPLQIAALIDTGASLTIVNPQVARTCQLPIIGKVTLSVVGGVNEYLRYAAAISFPGTSLRTLSPVSVTAVPIGAQPIACLLGRDILQHWRIVYDGATGDIEIEEK